MKRRKSLAAAAAPVDRLSDLPQDILQYQILSRLRTDEVIKTCVLSSKLVSLWLSLPVLDFEYAAAASSVMLLDEFLNRVGRIIQQRSQHSPTAVLHIFRLYLTGYRCDHPDGCIDDAISFAVKNGVKELVLETHPGFYPLPDIAFAGSVTLLTLVGIKVKKLNQLLHGCPLLENLKLSSCIVPQHAKISGSKIQSLHFIGYCDLKSVDIDCPRLQFLTFGCYFGRLDHFSLATPCRHFLKTLSLIGVPITDNLIENLLPIFALLEMLELTYCDELKIIKVSKNSNLKQVWFKQCQGLQDVDVRVTDLEYFSFLGMRGDHYNGELKRDRICNIDIIHCKHLRRMSLRGCGIPQELLHEQVPKLLQLDRLELDFHSFRDHRVVMISHEYLKHLELFNHRRILNTNQEVKINTPRLVSFSYNASFDTINPFVSFIYNPTLSAAITFYWKTLVTPLETSFFENWYGLIRLMDGCKLLTFSGDCKNLIFPRDLREALASSSVRLKHIRVQLYRTKMTVELLDSVLWLAPYLQTLVFATDFPNETILLSIKFEYDQWATEEDSPVNPSDVAARHHSSRKVDMEIYEEVEERVNLLKYFKDEVKSVRLIKLR